jgi:hypothetical protein
MDTAKGAGNAVRLYKNSITLFKNSISVKKNPFGPAAGSPGARGDSGTVKKGDYSEIYSAIIP